MITFSSTGDFRNTQNFLNRMLKDDLIRNKLEGAGRQGVAALAAGTPVDSGDTKNAWGYEVKQDSSGYAITWTNSNVVGGVPLVIMLQFGHGTGTGGYVAGRDFINPALKPIFDKIAEDVWREVVSA